METSAEVLEGNRAKVTVTVDASTVSSRIKGQYKKYANQYNFPGFRKGKAPRPVIDNALGKEAVPATVTDDVINSTLARAIDQNDLYPVGDPKVDDDVALVKDGEDYTYTFEIDTKPEIELSSYDPVEIELPSEEVSDKDIDDEVAQLQQHYAEIVDAPANTKVKAENFVDMTVKATDDDGMDVKAISQESTQYGIGSGLFPSTFDDEIMGLKKGDTKQFVIDVPSEPTPMTSDLIGKSAQIHFDVTINVVKKRKLPEVTDAWVSDTLGLKDVAELRDTLKDQIADQKNQFLPRLKESRVLDALVERVNEDDVPQSMVDDEETDILRDFYRQLQAQGITFDAYLQQQGMNAGQLREDVKVQAKEVTKQNLALDAWGKQKGLAATEADIDDEFAKAGVSDPEALKKQWLDNGQMYLVRQGIIRQKALDDLKDTAVVTEEADADEKKSSKKADKAEKAEKADDKAEKADAE